VKKETEETRQALGKQAGKSRQGVMKAAMKKAVAAEAHRPATTRHPKIKPIAIQLPCRRKRMLRRSQPVSDPSRHARTIPSSSLETF
jgi:hypothetical protein